MSETVTITVRRRWLRTLVVVGATAAVVAPATVWASDVFTDVGNSNVFHDDIRWLEQAGVTRGCNPPANTRFCPQDEVTRQQMAAFVRRLAGAGVVDAATATTADTATNAQRLGGRSATQYRRAIGMTTGATTPVDDGEIGVVEVAVPATGVVVLRHDEFWGLGAFELETWMEPRQPVGQRCNQGGYTESHAVQGTMSALSRVNEPAQDDYGQTVGSGWVDATAGTRRYSLCIDTFSGTPLSLGWSASAEWYPSAVATVSD